MLRKVKKIVSDSEKPKDRTSEEKNSGGGGEVSGPGHSGPVHSGPSSGHCGSVSGVSTLVPNNSPTHHIPNNTPNEVTNLTNPWNGNLVMYPTQPNPNPTPGGTYPHYLTTCYPFVQESYYFLPQSNCYRSQVRKIVHTGVKRCVTPPI